MSDPLTQIAAITELTEAFPGQTAKLCPILSDSQARQRCERLNERPHLWTKTRKTETRTEGKSLEPVKITSELKKTPPLDSGCEDGSLKRSCIDEKAAEAARLGDVKRAAGLCKGVKSPKWTGECFFQAAEAAVMQRKAFGYGDGVELCMAAEPFIQNCQSHLIMLLSQSAPSSKSGKPEDWAEIKSSSNAVRSAWSWRDKNMAQMAGSRLWSEAIGVAYARSKPVTGDSLDALGTDYAPFIRAAVMRRLMLIDPPKTHSLSEWINLASEAMKARENGNAQRDLQGKFIAAADLWPKDTVPPEGSKTIAYMATSTRIHSSDPVADLHICALEAAARIPPDSKKLLIEGQAHENEEVKWTANRLLKLIEN